MPELLRPGRPRAEKLGDPHLRRRSREAILRYSRFRICATWAALLVWTIEGAEQKPIAPSPLSVSGPSYTRPTNASHQWLSIPIEISGLPAQAEFLPVRCQVDFTAWLRGSNVPGAVDERSLRLFRVTPRGQEEIACQFRAADQPRPKIRRTLPDTPPNVSYLGEYAAGETPGEIKAAGELSWVVQKSINGGASYRLEFGVPRNGKLIQVPFAPQNLRAFDAEGRGTSVRWFPRMQMHPQWPFEGVVHISEGKAPITTYHLGPPLASLAASNPNIRRPFFYPVNGLDGISLTEFGKPHDPTGSHAHHYSLWIAHASVNGQDFWSERGGIIAHEQLELMEDGPIFCRLVQKTRWVNQGQELLRERRSFTVYQSGDDFRLIDVELSLTPAGSNPVTFGKTSFGFLAARVAQSMTVFDGAGEIRNANGDLNEQRAHLKRAFWMDQSGPVSQGRWGGIAMFDHPDNPNFPTGWHCRNDGWAGAAFNMEAPYTLEPGATLRLRYRILLHGQDAMRGGVAQRYEEYRARPVVQFGKVKLEK
ncbi:MAG: PmoA family protein [Verrucomicrobia bacterium]|nr:PmoA family protein [Verrucomicrobiota bacterium]